MPPLWSFGTWMSRITYFSEAEGRDVARKLRENKIPSDVIHFDTGWFGVDWQCDYAFAADRFDNPRQMLTDLRSQGFRTCLWQLPYFTPKNKFFPELVERGLYVRNGKGQLPYEDVVLDFTNPETVQWYQEKLGNLIEMGVGAIKVDFGEGAPLDAIYANGRSGLYEHNLYPLRYNKTVAEVIKKIHGENIIWARSAWAGSQRYPLHWGGDAATTETGFEGTIRSGLSIGLSGFCFWSNDIGGIKVDFGEGAPLDAIYANGRSGLYEHNLYPLRYNKTVAEVIKKIHGENIIWARSAWAGSQRYPLHWGGDAATTETGFEGTIRSGLSIGLSGFCFWSNDIGGFVTQSPESLYRRWLPFGFLTSHSRVHGAPPTEPWYYGKEFTDYFRRCAELKYKLMPYVYAQSKECTENGWPMLRALLLEYPDDPGAWLVEDEYMFGSNLLVAPMLEEGSGRDVYLPGRQKWIDYQTGKVYAPGWNHIECGTLPIVILVKDGSAIPHIPVAQCTDQMKWDKITWKKYLADEKKAEGLLCLPQDGQLQRISIP